MFILFCFYILINLQNYYNYYNYRPYTTELRHEFSDYTKQILFDEPNEINLVGFKDLINKLQLALSADGYTNENVVK